MADSVRRHREAADRHEQTAARHDDAAVFWVARHDAARADLHRDAAAHERGGAALERRWAALIAAETPDAQGSGDGEDDAPATEAT